MKRFHRLSFDFRKQKIACMTSWEKSPKKNNENYWKTVRRNHFLWRSENWLEFVGAILTVIGVRWMFLALMACWTVVCCIRGLCSGARSWNGCPPCVSVTPAGVAALIACCAMPLTLDVTNCAKILLALVPVSYKTITFASFRRSD